MGCNSNYRRREVSELTPCNYCSFKRIKRRAKQDNNTVTLRYGFMGGKDCFVHPPDVVITPEIAKDENHPLHKQYFVAWFMELPDHCCC